MNPRQLQIIIRAQNETRGAFNDVSRQFHSIHGQINVFNRRALSLPRVISSMFFGVGSAIAHTLTQVDRGFSTLGALHRMRGNQLIAQAQSLAARAAAITKLDPVKGAMFMGMANVARRQGQRQVAGGENLEVIGALIGGFGRLLGPLLGIAGSLVSILVRGFTSLLSIVWDVAKTIGGAMFGAARAVLGVVATIGEKLFEVGRDFAEKGIDFNSFKEQTHIAFEVMFKSIDMAQSKFSWLKRFADITPFDLKETINAGKQLTAYGLEMERWIRVAGNMSAAFNKPLAQSVELLGRAKAGIYASRSFAPFGITRDSLRSVGVEFNKTGAPVDRSKVLPGVEKLVNRDFSGMLERQGRSAAGLQERLGAFWTEEFPGLVTSGLFTAYKATLDFIGQFIDAARKSGQLERIGKAIGMVFDTVGAVLYRTATLLPSVVAWFDQIVQTGKWQRFLEVVWDIFSTIFETAVNGVKWVYSNWSTIWPMIAGVSIGAVKVIGGAVAGVINVFSEWIDQGGSIQDVFRIIGEALRGFSLLAVNSLVKVVGAIFLLQAAIGIIIFSIGAMARSLPVMIQGLTGMVIGLTGAFATLGIGNLLKGGIQNFDVSKFFPDMSTLNQRKDALGSFARGYEQFGKTVDKVFKELNGRPLPDLPGFPGSGPVPKGIPVTLGEEELATKAREALKKRLEILKEETQAWAAILDATKAYAEILSDPAQAMNLQFQAMMGQLGALNRLKDGQLQYLQYLDFGTKEWWESMTAINTTAKEVNAVRDEVRKLIFDVQKLEAATSFSEKLFKIGKDIGLGSNEMQAIANDQFQLLTSTLLVERARLSTLNNGTLEWHKQRTTILDVISKIIALKKELGETNLKIAGPKLMSPRTPFGMRGAAFGPELMRGDSNGAGAKSIMDLIQFALSPAKKNLDIMAQGFFPGAIPGNMSGLDQVLTPAKENANAMAPLFQGVTTRLDQIKSILSGGVSPVGGSVGASPSGIVGGFNPNGGNYSGSVTHTQTTKKLVQLAASLDDLAGVGFKIPSSYTTTQRRTDIFPDVNVSSPIGQRPTVSGLTPEMMRQYGIGLPGGDRRLPGGNGVSGSSGQWQQSPNIMWGNGMGAPAPYAFAGRPMRGEMGAPSDVNINPNGRTRFHVPAFPTSPGAPPGSHSGYGRDWPGGAPGHSKFGYGTGRYGSSGMGMGTFGAGSGAFASSGGLVPGTGQMGGPAGHADEMLQWLRNRQAIDMANRVAEAAKKTAAMKAQAAQAARDNLLSPAHNLYGQYQTGPGSVSMAPTGPATPGQVGPWDFWGPSVRANSQVGLPSVTPGQKYYDNAHVAQWEVANVRTATPPPARGGGIGDGSGISISIPISIMDAGDEQKLRQLAREAADQGITEALSQVRRKKATQGAR